MVQQLKHLGFFERTVIDVDSMKLFFCEVRGILEDPSDFLSFSVTATLAAILPRLDHAYILFHYTPFSTISHLFQDWARNELAMCRSPNLRSNTMINTHTTLQMEFMKLSPHSNPA